MVLFLSMRARVVKSILKAYTATIAISYDDSTEIIYEIKLRDWKAPNGETFALMAEEPRIPDSDMRNLINMALLRHQEYIHAF